MYIVIIAWLYVVFMMSITEASAVAGIATFLLYGVLPAGLILYLGGTRRRRRKRKAQQESNIGRKTETKPDADSPSA